MADFVYRVTYEDGTMCHTGYKPLADVWAKREGAKVEEIELQNPTRLRIINSGDSMSDRYERAFTGANRTALTWAAFQAGWNAAKSSDQAIYDSIATGYSRDVWEQRKAKAWAARDLSACNCDHNEYCGKCWPVEFRKGGEFYEWTGEPSRTPVANRAETSSSPTWQPIDSAPRHKKVLVGYRNRLNNWRTVVACYYPAGTLELSDDSYELSEDGYAEEGWYEECESQENIYPVEGEPTHWQPLPPAPAGSPPGGSLVGLSQDDGVVIGTSDVDQGIPVPAAGAKEEAAVLINLGLDRPEHDAKATGAAGPHEPHATPGEPLTDAEVFQLLEIHGIPCDPATAAAIAEIVERAHGIGVMAADVNAGVAETGGSVAVELKPCPFCGGDAELDTRPSYAPPPVPPCPPPARGVAPVEAPITKGGE